MASIVPHTSPGRGASGFASTRLLCLLASAIALSGCDRTQIAVYEAPKDSAPRPAMDSSQGDPARASNPLTARPGLTWSELPEGWTSLGPSGMRAANFRVPSPEGETADVAVIPLQGTGGSDLDLVNLWRGLLELQPITDSELPSHTSTTTIRGREVKLFSIVGSGTADSAAASNQIVVAALPRDGFTWFFKLAGSSAAVEGNRAKLLAFLEAVEFTAPASTPAQAQARASTGGAGSSPAPSGPPPKPVWDIPATWQATPPPPMVHTKWVASSGPQITVSVFPGETGGLPANVDRWRSQVSLPPATASDLEGLANNMDVLGGKATLVDLTGTDPATSNPLRLVGVVVGRDGFYWFYKLMGVPDEVEAERPSFIKFVQTTQYPPRS